MYGETTPNSAAALMYGEIIPKLIIIITVRFLLYKLGIDGRLTEKCPTVTLSDSLLNMIIIKNTVCLNITKSLYA